MDSGLTVRDVDGADQGGLALETGAQLGVGAAPLDGREGGESGGEGDASTP